MNKKHLFCTAAALWALSLSAQSLEHTIEERLKNYFNHYTTTRADIGPCQLERFEVDHQRKELRIYASPSFGYQPFTEATTTAVYRELKQLLPGPVNYYQTTLYADGQPIENLVPNALRRKKDDSRLFPRQEADEAPWTCNLSRPYRISQGLEGRHIALWQSHGRYFQNASGEWKWQRPRLFCTTEDLFTQAFVVPYLIPMLENAGAVVFTPRERDRQPNEVIVDNNTCSAGSRYLEVNYKKKYRWATAPGKGFAQQYATYPDGHNPFEDGTARFIPTYGKPEKAFAEWIPNLPAAGRYAVYVSYQTLPESVTDARYTVFHKGGATHFRVNQRMGGGTWVYLGTFEFDPGANDTGMVVLSNQSSERGVVSADAVRFGGGMGNIERGGTTSGMPRYLEGARYWAQWAGMPYPVYSKSQGQNDYNDDINARSLTTNYLAGGSPYAPGREGLRVPVELTIGLHSDAGFKTDDALVGSLGIYTTQFNEGRLGCGTSRYASRDLADLVLTGLQRDLAPVVGTDWARRSLWNRNYSETRLPEVPSMILELLSHQNFADLQQGYRPDFQFAVGRSVYKSVLRFLATQHRERYTVQPLPVNHFAIEEGAKKNTFELRWQPVDDPLEPTAKAQGYVVYTRIGNGGFDNGTYVDKNRFTVKAEPGLTYSFRVTAVNKGGESFPSETLSAYKAPHSRGTLLIVNGFHRTSGPAAINTSLQQGFDLALDPGLPYLSSASFCGYQQNFDRTRPGLETPDGLGYSGNELEGFIVAGNTFDYPFLHGKAIQHAGGYSYVSCSSETLESGSVLPDGYLMVDYIAGAEHAPLSPRVCDVLGSYLDRGGRLLLSGSCLGARQAGSRFLQEVLHCSYGGSLPPGPEGAVHGNRLQLSFPRRMNSQTYAVPFPECLQPVGNAFTPLVYTAEGYSAAVAAPGRSYVMGFPFESITDPAARDRLMQSVLQFLVPAKR